MRAKLTQENLSEFKRRSAMCGKIFRILFMSMVGICSAYGQTFSSYDYPGAYTTGLGVITGAGDIFGGYNNGPDNCCLYLGRHAFLLPGGLSGTPVSMDVTQQEAPGNQSTLLFAVNPGFQINGPGDYTGQVGGEYTDSGITAMAGYEHITAPPVPSLLLTRLDRRTLALRESMIRVSPWVNSTTPLASSTGSC